MPCRRLRCGLSFAWMVVLAAVPGAAGCSPAGDSTVGPATRGDEERGRKLLSQYQCGACHTIPGVASAQGQHASSLQSFGLRSYIAGRQVNRPELLERWISQPHALIPGTEMPAMGVSPEDARDMAAYLRELR